MVASGTRRGSAESTPSTSVPDLDLGRIQQRAEDRRREVRPIAPERGLHPTRVTGDEAGDDQGVCARLARRALGEQPLQAALRFFPLHRRTQCAPIHHHAAPRVQPLHAAARTAPLQIAREQPRRPDLAEACDQVVHGLRRRAHHPCGLQHPSDRLEILIEAAQVGGRLRRIEQRLGDRGMPRAQRRQALLPAIVLAFGQRHELQQQVGDALAGR